MVNIEEADVSTEPAESTIVSNSDTEVEGLVASTSVNIDLEKEEPVASSSKSYVPRLSFPPRLTATVMRNKKSQPVAEPSSSTSAIPESASQELQDLRTKYLMNDDMPPTDCVVVLKANGASYPFHKIVLTEASKVLNCLVKENLEKLHVDAGNVNLKLELNFSKDVFEVLKAFLYSLRLPQDISLDLAFRTLQETSMYDIDGLKDSLVLKIKEKITNQNAFDILKLAGQAKVEKLQDEVRRFMCWNGSFFLNHNQFAKLGYEDFTKIIMSDNLAVGNEVEVFNAAFRWATEKAEGKEEKLQEMLQLIIRGVRFPLMSPSEFATVTALHSILIDVLTMMDFFKINFLITLPDNVNPDLKQAVMEATPFSSTPRLNRPVAVVSSESFTPPPSSPEDVDGGKRKRSVEEEDGSTIPISDPEPIYPTSLNLESDLQNLEDVNTDLTRKRLKIADSLPDQPLAGPSRCAAWVEESTSQPAQEDDAEVESNESYDDDDDDPIYRSVIVQEEQGPFRDYDSVMRRHCKNNKEVIGKVDLRNLKIMYNYKPVYTSKNAEINIDLCYDHLKNDEDDGNRDIILQFIRSLDVRRYLRFRVEDDSFPVDTDESVDLKEMWHDGHKVDLVINGIKLVKMNPEQNQLMLNYFENPQMLIGSSQVCLKHFSLSNSPFDLNRMKKSNLMENLVLYRVWGSFNIDGIFRKFPKLQELTCWKKIPDELDLDNSSGNPSDLLQATYGVPLVLSLSSPLPNTLRKLVLFRSEIKFSSSTLRPTNIEELCLEYCDVNVSSCSKWVTSFLRLFPKLKRVMLINKDEGDLERDSDGEVILARSAATPQLVGAMCKNLKDLQWVRVLKMKWPSSIATDADPACYETRKMFKKMKLPDSPTNFILEKNGEYGEVYVDSDDEDENDLSAESSSSKLTRTKKRAGLWKGLTYKHGEKLENGVYWETNGRLEYEWYSSDHFYCTYDAYEQYFIGDETPFPALRLF